MKRLALAWWARCTGTLFGRLALLLMGTALLSHVLALTLVFRVMSGGRGDPPPPRPPLAGDAGWARGAKGAQGPLMPPMSASEPGPQPAPGAFGPPRPPGPPGPHRPHGPSSWGMAADVGIRLAAILLAAWVAARWLVRPIQRLAQAAHALGEDIDRPPMAEAGPLEVREATRTFNQMQARIREQISDRDRFVAAVSHDLRTPLTRLRLRTEGLADEAERERFRRDIADMDQMIAVTLDYLRGAAAAEPSVRLDIEALAHTVAEDLQDQGCDVQVHGRAQALVAPANALRRCLDNLVDNAIRYGHRADIHLIDSAEALRIEVRDAGPGLPDSELARVMAPFYRVEGSRNRAHGGVGLGLSITQDIVRRQGGELTLRNGSQGGLVAILVLPRPPQEAAPASSADADADAGGAMRMR